MKKYTFPTFDRYQAEKPGNGAALMLVDQKLSLSRQLAQSKGRTDSWLSPISYTDQKMKFVQNFQRQKEYQKELLKKRNAIIQDKLLSIAASPVSKKKLDWYFRVVIGDTSMNHSVL